VVRHIGIALRTTDAIVRALKDPYVLWAMKEWVEELKKEFDDKVISTLSYEQPNKE